MSFIRFVAAVPYACLNKSFAITILFPNTVVVHSGETVLNKYSIKNGLKMKNGNDVLFRLLGNTENGFRTAIKAR